jgi:transposase
MCDALSRNVPKLGPGVELLIGNCLAHGRRQFVEIVGNFPEQCRYVLETLGKIYGLDALARERKLTPAERLSFHKENSKPLMDELATWFRAQFDERKVEPNSGLGKAITYMQRHWLALTLFLEEEGAPLDNNATNAASGIYDGMPTSELCRVARTGGPSSWGLSSWALIQSA